MTRLSDKEVWEPIVQLLLKPRNLEERVVTIREVWSFDFQNHGEGAVLNDSVLATESRGLCEWLMFA